MKPNPRLRGGRHIQECALGFLPSTQPTIFQHFSAVTALAFAVRRELHIRASKYTENKELEMRKCTGAKFIVSPQPIAYV